MVFTKPYIALDVSALASSLTLRGSASDGGLSLACTQLSHSTWVSTYGLSLCRRDSTLPTPARSIGTISYTLRHSSLTFSSRLRGRCRSRTCTGSCRPLPPMHKVGIYNSYYTATTVCANIVLANVRNGAAFRCLEAVGQAISYGMNTQIKTSPLIGL